MPLRIEAEKVQLAGSLILQLKMVYQSGKEGSEKKSFHLGGNWLGDVYTGTLSGRVTAFLLPMMLHPQTNVQRLKRLCEIAREAEQRPWPSSALEYIEHTLDLDGCKTGEHWLPMVMFS